MLPTSLRRTGSISELLEPAIEGPPSPETIRAMNMQMRMANSAAAAAAASSTLALHKNTNRQSHQTTSSGSSSLRSMASSAADRRPSWDLAAMEASTTSTAPTSASSSLSRKSSGRSTVSTQPRDSVQIFGKNIFGRRTRARRESSAQSSSASSIYSTDAVPPPTARSALDMDSSSSICNSSISDSTPASLSYARNSTALPSTRTRPTSSKPFSITSTKESIMPFFQRRRANTRSDTIDEESSAEGGGSGSVKKLQISGPFNFQHLTSPKKGSRTSFVVSSSSPDASDDGSTSFFPDFTSVGVAAATATTTNTAVPTSAPHRPPMRPHAASVSGAVPMIRTLNHTRSQDQLRYGPMPPRPPRSPIEASSSFSTSSFSSSHMSFSPPMPPPRLSSRASLGAGDLGTIARTRPQTSGGFRQTTSSFASFAASSASSYAHAHTHAHSYSADLGMVPLEMRRFTQMPALVSATVPLVSPPLTSAPHDDSNWPLPPASSSVSASASSSSPFPDVDVASPCLSMTSATTAACGTLPGVPEEEDEFNPRSSGIRRSCMSIASNASSSLRKSHSEPLLQQFPQPPTSPRSPRSPLAVARPPSAASDTLGTDVERDLAEDRYAYANYDDSDLLSLGANWEDDIDYCYEHEIEADCEYAWERSSLDLSRDELDSESTTPSNNYNNNYTGYNNYNNYNVSPQLLLNHGSFDMPELSPASHASTTSMSDLASPTMLAASGFAPRRNHSGLTIHTGGHRERTDDRFLHARSGSRASMLSESLGFDLSPSLFIPGSDKYGCRQPVVGGSGGVHGFAFGCEEEEMEMDEGGDDMDDDAVSQHMVADMMPPYLDGQMILGMNKAMLYMPTRTSASTTGSGESRDSMQSSHVSAASTDLTCPSMEDLRFNKNPNRESLIIPLF